MEHLVLGGKSVELGPGCAWDLVREVLWHYPRHRFPNIRKLTIENLCIVPVDQMLQDAVKNLPRSATWQLQPSDDTVNAVWKSLGGKSPMPTIKVPYVSGRVAKTPEPSFRASLISICLVLVSIRRNCL